MSQAPFTLTRDWTNPDENNGGFATYLADEETVRLDMQCLFTELLNNINTLLAVLQNVGGEDSGEGGANEIGIDEISGLADITTVQGALKELKSQVDAATTGTLPDHSITADKLSRSTDVGGAAVTPAATDFSTGLNVAGTSGRLVVGQEAGDYGHFDVDSYGRIYLSRYNGSTGYVFGTGGPPNANLSIGRLYFKKVNT